VYVRKDEHSCAVAFVYGGADLAVVARRKSRAKSSEKEPESSEKEPTKEELLAARIRQARTLAGKANKSAFARELDTTPTTIYRWESAKVVPDIWNLAKIARATTTSMEWLVSGEASASVWLRSYLDEAREAGRQLPPDEIAFLLGVPLMGRVPTPAFFDYAIVAYRNGLSPAEAARAASATLTLVHDSEKDRE
jgi:transcriptional regulator with XRE-family HTH domain